MDIGTFWDIIETARASAGPDRPFHESLTDHLATLTEDDILEYHERFEKVHDALYRYDLWAAAYLIQGGCSDDSFIDFRAGLIAQGRDWYEQATTSPDSLADHPAVAGAGHPLADNPLFYEEVNYAASCAFDRVSGGEDAFWDALKERGPRVSVELMGEDFDFDDDQEMRRRLPRLSSCCLGSSPLSQQDGPLCESQGSKTPRDDAVIAVPRSPRECQTGAIQTRHGGRSYPPPAPRTPGSAD